MVNTFELYEPTDVEEQYELWGANCGPCCLAAVLKRSIKDIRKYLKYFDKLKYVNPTHMFYKKYKNSTGYFFRTLINIDQKENQL